MKLNIINVCFTYHISLNLKSLNKDNNDIINYRCFTYNESSDTIIINNSPSSFKHGFSNAKDNLTPVVIHINNSINSTNNKVQIKVSNSPVKLSTLNMKTVYASDDFCTNCKNR